MPVIILFFVVIALLTLFQGHLDKQRIRRSAEKKGWRDVKVSWYPFLLGSLTDRNERGYRVDYRDSDGTERFAYCKTSILGGIFWRDD